MNLRLRALCAATAVFAVASCDRRPNEIVHPTPENLPPPNSPVIRSEGVPLGLDAGALESWTSVRDGLLSDWEVSAALGQLGGGIGDDAQDVFGIDIDLVVDRESIIVLDRQDQSVKIFGREGSYLGSFGRAGPGPGEFMDPSKIERLPDNRLVVLDRGRALKIYAQTDTGYVYAQTRGVDVVPEYMCTAGGRLFVSGWRQEDETMIHELSLDDSTTTRHFGQGYQSDHWLAEDQLSDGPIACVGEPLRIVFAFEDIPVARGYDPEGGALLWTARVEDWLQAPVTEFVDANGRKAIQRSRRGPRDQVMSLTTVSSRHVLLQSFRGEPAPDPADVQIEVRSYLIDVATGQGAFISSSLPLIAEAERDVLVAKWILPFPRIELRTKNSP